MAKVRLKGLSIYQRRGKWYVYFRANGRALVKGFQGTRSELTAYLETPTALKTYGEIADQPKAKGFGTLAGLIDYYKSKKRWQKLAPRTQADYQKVFDWLDQQKALSTPVITILPKHVSNVRDKAAEDRYPKFSNDLLSCLSAAFSVGVEYGYADLKFNPVKEIPRIHKNSKTANRRWTDDEWSKIWQIAPAHLKTVLAVAKWAGLRGQDIAVLRWDNLVSLDNAGMFLEFTALKNGEECLVSVLPPLQEVLDAETKSTLTICKNSLGRPYPSENAMRKAWQDFKQSPFFENLIPTGKDLTLHGLRVTYASELEELGFSDEDKAKAIGDKSAAMGKHYSRDAAKVKFALRVKNAKTA